MAKHAITSFPNKLSYSSLLASDITKIQEKLSAPSTQSLLPELFHKGITYTDVQDSQLEQHERILNIIIDMIPNIPEIRYHHNFTPLMIAAQFGLHNVMNKLLDRGCDISARSDNGINALHTSVYSKHNSIDFIKKILSIAPNLLDSVNVEEYSILMLAAQEGNIEIVKYLLSEHRPNLTTTSKNGNALTIAVHQKQSLELIELLFDQFIKLPDTKYVSEAFDSAITSGRADALAFFADKRDWTKDSPHALCLAAAKTIPTDKSSIIDILLQIGFDINAIADTPLLHYEKIDESISTSTMLSTKDLLGHEEDYSNIKSISRTPLMLVVGKQNIGLIKKFLVEYKADPNIRNAEGHTAFSMASAHKNKSVISVLLETPNISQETILGGLLYAAQYNITESISTILNHKKCQELDLNSNSALEGMTLMTTAIQYNSINVIELLLDGHSKVNYQFLMNKILSKDKNIESPDSIRLLHPFLSHAKSTYAIEIIKYTISNCNADILNKIVKLVKKEHINECASDLSYSLSTAYISSTKEKEQKSFKAKLSYILQSITDPETMISSLQYANTILNLEDDLSSLLSKDTMARTNEYVRAVKAPLAKIFAKGISLDKIKKEYIAYLIEKSKYTLESLPEITSIAAINGDEGLLLKIFDLYHSSDSYDFWLSLAAEYNLAKIFTATLTLEDFSLSRISEQTLSDIMTIAHENRDASEINSALVKLIHEKEYAHIAAENGSHRTFKLLHKYGININSKHSFTGLTPMETAIKKNQARVVKELLALKIDISNIRTDQIKNPDIKKLFGTSTPSHETTPPIERKESVQPTKEKPVKKVSLLDGQTKYDATLGKDLIKITQGPEHYTKTHYTWIHTKTAPSSAYYDAADKIAAYSEGSTGIKFLKSPSHKIVECKIRGDERLIGYTHKMLLDSEEEVTVFDLSRFTDHTDLQRDIISLEKQIALIAESSEYATYEEI
ncbi:MAG: hypothetical protein RLZZ59_499 [Pseudomonadota bacterium]|jgi:ankyrin repeat protein